MNFKFKSEPHILDLFYDFFNISPILAKIGKK